MTKLSPEAQAIIDAGRSAQAPSAATKAKVLQSLELQMASPPASSSLAPGSAHVGIGKVLIFASIVAALGVGYFLVRGTERGNDSNTLLTTALVPLEVPVAAPVAVPAAAPLAPAVEDEASAAPETLGTESERAPGAESGVVDELSAPQQDKSGARKRSSKRAASPFSSTETLLAEQALVGAAQQATRDGDYGQAQRLLAQHQREFPRGVLAPERKAARAIALCLSGQVEEGAQAAEKFLESHARSPLATQVKKSCKLP